jgi:hypothetical protein
MRKALIILLFILVKLSMLTIGAYYLLNHMDLSSHLMEAKDRDKIKYELSTISLWPTPHIILKNIHSDNGLELRQAKIIISVMSLLKLNPNISNIELNQGSIDLKALQMTIKQRLQIIDNFLNYKNTLSKISFKNINIYGLSTETININQLQLVKNNGLISLEVWMKNNDKYYATISSTNQGLIGRLWDGSFSLELHHNPSSSGVIKFNVININNFLAKFISKNSINPFDFSDAASFSLEARVIKHDDKINIEPFKVVSNVIDKIDGSVSLDADSFAISDVNFALGSLNLNVFSKFKDSSFNKFDSLNLESVNYINNNFNYNVQAAKVVLPNQLILSNIQAEGSFEGEIFNFKNFNGKIGEKGSFSIFGKLQPNKFRPSFEGKVLFENIEVKRPQNLSKENVNPQNNILNVAANLYATEKELSFSSIEATFNETVINGSVSLKLIGLNNRMQSNLNIKNFNQKYINYDYINNIFKRWAALFLDMKNKDYLQKFAPLRENKFLSNVTLNFKDTTINDRLFQDFFINLNIKPEGVCVNSLTTTSGEEYLKINAKLDYANIIPIFQLNILSGNLKLQNFLNIEEATSNFLVNNFDSDKIKMVVSAHSLALNIQNKILNNVSFELQNRDSILVLSNFNASFLGGALTGSANLSLNPYNFTAAYALNNFSLNEFITDQLIKNGVASLSGSAEYEDKTKILTAKGNFIAKSMDIQSLSIDDFILKITDPLYNSQNLDTDAVKFLTQGSTFVKEIQGKFTTNNHAISLSDITLGTNYSSGVCALVFDEAVENIKGIAKIIFNPARQGQAQKTQPIGLYLNLNGKIDALEKSYNIKEIKDYFERNKVK